MGSKSARLAAALALGLTAAASTQAQGATFQAPNLPSLAPLVEAVRQSVVNVEVVSRIPAEELSGTEGLLERFFGVKPPAGQELIRRGAGSGFIVDAKGLVVTNNHVVQDAQSIRVTLGDGRAFDARVLGRDELTDVAVVKLEGKVENLPVAKLGDSDAVRVGDWVVAIGNPFGLPSSVSAGIISAKARNINVGPYDDFLQTDAAINPGNSGGPLFDLGAEVVGMNTAIVGGGAGIGFAVPSTTIKALLPPLEKGQAVKRGWLGVAAQDLTPDLAKALKVPVTRGAVVADADKKGPAAKAGVQRDDAITAVDGKQVDSAQALTRTIGFKPPGSNATLTVHRGGKKQEIQVTLGERPAPAAAKPASREQPPRRGQIGLEVQDMDPALQAQLGVASSRGAVVTRVQPGSPADDARLQPGMVVIEAGGKPVASANDLVKAIHDAKHGSVLLLRVEVSRAGTLLRALEIP